MPSIVALTDVLAGLAAPPATTMRPMLNWLMALRNPEDGEQVHLEEVVNNRPCWSAAKVSIITGGGIMVALATFGLDSDWTLRIVKQRRKHGIICSGIGA